MLAWAFLGCKVSKRSGYKISFALPKHPLAIYLEMHAHNM